MEALSTRRSPYGRIILGVLGILLFVLFAGLGTWQVVRLQWKLALIARVDSRVSAPPVAAPSAPQWASVSKESDEYRRVNLAGHFLYEYSTPVKALSALGSGYWLLTPLCRDDGSIVLVNRGFIPDSANRAGAYLARRAQPGACAAGASTASTITGLLRLPETGGGFLRDNDPAKNRWFSRDIAGIAAARGLGQVAPYFIDAARGQDPAGAPEQPVGGLTVISFQNNHLVYGFTWYALALMVVAAWWFVARFDRNKRTGKANEDGSKT